MKTERHEYLRAMVRHYIGCAIWCGHYYETPEDEAEGTNSIPMDWAGYSEDDCTFATWKQAVRDCRDFMELTADIAHDWSAEQFGHDFYLTRCGHGAGFWDRGKGRVGEQLTALCRPYGSADLYVNANNQVEWM